MKKTFLIASGLVALSACSDPNQAPVIFGQTQTLGVSVGSSATGVAPDVTVGFKDANIAILPTNAITTEGNYEFRGGISGEDGRAFEDTYSTFGQFKGSAESGKVGLEKFFATGLAAQKLSAGFACGVSDGRDKDHCHAPK